MLVVILLLIYLWLFCISDWKEAKPKARNRSNVSLWLRSDGSHRVCFLSQVGHLHAGCSKGVIVTFCSNEPLSLTNQSVACSLCQVTFEKPTEEVADWDDKQNTTAECNGEEEVGGCVWRAPEGSNGLWGLLNQHASACLPPGAGRRLWALPLCGEGLTALAGVVYQSSLWLCEVQLQHGPHSLQWHRHLPKQHPPVSRVLELSSVCRLIHLSQPYGQPVKAERFIISTFSEQKLY